MSTTHALLIAVVAIAALTFAIRLFMIAVFTQREIPRLLENALRYVPAAVLTALVAPDFLAPKGVLELSLANHKLVAGVLVAGVAWKTKGSLAALLVGIAALYALSALSG